MSLAVLRAGFLTTVQDTGRGGYRASGVGRAGALDAMALRVANLLAGNNAECAGLEMTFGNARLRFADERLVAWCGGAFAVRLPGKELPAGRTAFVRSGDELELAAPASGARAWLAISGGVEVPQVLGSRATDLRSGFGGLAGRALRDGDELPLGQPAEGAERLARKLSDSSQANWSAPNEWSKPRSSHGILRLVRGADGELFAPETFAALLQSSFEIAPDSNRMGLRLRGSPLPRKQAGDLVSEAVAPGTIQVPPSGDPILLLNDCQTIGGYPKIAHVITVDLAAAAQLMPGDQVRFAEVSLGEAEQLLLERERDLQWFRAGVALKMA